MDLFARTFQRSIVDVKKLLSFGFREVGGVYEYHAPILEGSFEAEVFYSTDKGFYGRLIDNAVGKEYLLLTVDGVQGDFHNKVRNASRNSSFPFVHRAQVRGVTKPSRRNESLKPSKRTIMSTRNGFGGNLSMTLASSVIKTL